MEITKEEMARRFRERTTKNLCPTMGGGSFLYRKASSNNQNKSTRLKHKFFHG
jgi:hypothetical protein